VTAWVMKGFYITVVLLLLRAARRVDVFGCVYCKTNTKTRTKTERVEWGDGGLFSGTVWHTTIYKTGTRHRHGEILKAVCVRAFSLSLLAMERWMGYWDCSGWRVFGSV
jgi:hypothetical protein